MKIHYVVMQAIPLKTGKHHGIFKTATAHLWVARDNHRDCVPRAVDYLIKQGWEPTGVDRGPMEFTPESISVSSRSSREDLAWKNKLLFGYQEARTRGISALILAVPEGPEPDSDAIVYH